MITKTQAILSLIPSAEFIENNGNITWIDNKNQYITEEQIDEELLRLQAEYDAKEYQRKRATEYPPMTDYLDGIVKGDQSQVQAYIDACLAVKAKYPKGTA